MATVNIRGRLINLEQINYSYPVIKGAKVYRHVLMSDGRGFIFDEGEAEFIDNKMSANAPGNTYP